MSGVVAGDQCDSEKTTFAGQAAGHHGERKMGQCVDVSFRRKNTVPECAFDEWIQVYEQPRRGCDAGVFSPGRFLRRTTHQSKGVFWEVEDKQESGGEAGARSGSETRFEPASF